MTMADKYEKQFPHLLDQPTWTAMCRYLFGLEVQARRRGDGYTFSDFALQPVIRWWMKKNARTAQTLALMGGSFSRADLHYGPPTIPVCLAAIHAGPKTIDHEHGGREITTPQWAALHGW